MKAFFKIFLLLPIAWLASGCEDEAHDILPPAEYYIQLEDAETGADLLNPETEGNLLNDRVCAIENGKKHYIGNIPGSGNYFGSRLEWLRDYPYDTGRCVLVFRGLGYDAITTVVFDWGDGTKTQVDFLPHDYLNCLIWVDGIASPGKVGIVRK